LTLIKVSSTTRVQSRHEQRLSTWAMTAAISRRQFLRGDLSGRNAPLRPPWALAEAAFVERCDACGECIAACPGQILCQDSAGLPRIDFSRGECDFCGACVDTCSPQALAREPGEPPWSLAAFIQQDACLASRKVECRRCADPCASGAIRIRPRVGGFSVPEIDINRCSGCGACYPVCPVQAISLRAI
jgi:ferredoxin-type protein NapF